MDHKALTEGFLQDPWMNPDGSPVHWQKMLTHAMLHLAGQVEALTVVVADAFNDEDEP